MSDLRPDSASREQELLLLPKRSLADRGCASIVVDVKTTTPILGGGVQTRKVDDIDVLRPASIRGHLRFWWRALEGHGFNTAAELYKEEARLWGCAGGENGVGRSPVEISVEITDQSSTTDAPINIGTGDGYALWPARAQNDRPVAPRRMAGVRARLLLACPAETRDVVERTLRAWILFGGIGGRTRRGVGSLSCTNAGWLPAVKPPRMPSEDDYNADEFKTERERVVGAFTQELAQTLDGLLKGQYFQGGSSAVLRSFPLLSGASLIVGWNQQGTQLQSFQSAKEAWHVALQWLRDFRQAPGFARDGISWNDPGRSRWPEADKLRRCLDTHSHGHAPRHNNGSAWPRAGFGLPIVGRFRDAGDPGPFTISWAGADGKVRERMASPLIVKALPVKGGFLACALWLNRADPPGKVGVVEGDHLRANSQAAFDATVGPTHTPWLASKNPSAPFSKKDMPLRDAFLDWVAKQPGAWRVS